MEEGKERKKENEKKGAKKPGKVEKWSLRILFGDIVNSKFFVRNKFAIMLFILLSICYISFKYECRTNMEKIEKLEDSLAIVRSEGIREQSAYMSRTRESMMQKMVDSVNLSLRVQNQPPYILSYEKGK